MFIKSINNKITSLEVINYKITFINKVKNTKTYIIIISYYKPETLLRIFYL